MCLLDFGIIVLGEALGFQSQHVGNLVLIIQAERRPIITGAPGSLLGPLIGIVGLTGSQALIDCLKMLKFLIVQPEQKWGYDPIHMAVGTPVLDRQHCESFPEITLQRYAMKKRRIIRGGIKCRIAEGGKIVFKAPANSSASVFERLIEIRDHFISDRSQRGLVLPPHPQPITGMCAR